jgi:hypothetical protein
MHVRKLQKAGKAPLERGIVMVAITHIELEVHRTTSQDGKSHHSGALGKIHRRPFPHYWGIMSIR